MTVCSQHSIPTPPDRAEPVADHTYDAAMTSDAAPAESTPSRRGLVLAQRLLVTVAVLATVGTVLAIVLVQRVGETYQDGLDITSDGASVAALSAEQATTIVDEAGALAEAVAVALDQTETVLLAAATSLEEIGDAMGENIAESIEGIGEISDGLAGFIETVERFIPGDSDSLAESLRKVSDGLEPTPDQLRALAAQLDATAKELRATSASLQPIGNQVDALASSVDEGTAALAEVQRLARQVEARSLAALDRSENDLLLLQILIVVVGLGVVIASLATARAVRHLPR